MLKLYIHCILSVIFFTPFGYLFLKNKPTSIRLYSSQLVYGLIFLSFCALLINFFVPLNRYINTIFIIISLFILIRFHKIYYSRSFLAFSFFSSFFIFLLIVESNVYRPDAGLYHLPFINILNNEKIIFGLSNLHFRFGHISIIQYLSAISNNLLFGINGIVLASALVSSAIIINFLISLWCYNQKRIYNIHFFYLFSVTLFIFSKMIRYSEYGNDAPAHFVLFYLISEILKLKEINIDKFTNLFILTSFIIFNKITLLFVAFIPLFFLKKLKIKEIIKSKKFLFILIFVSLWFLKNFITTGCAIFPVKYTCIKSFSWNSLSLAKKISVENEAWTKGWPDYDISATKNKIILMNINDYSKNFVWFEYWYDHHFKKKIAVILAPYLLVLIIIYLILKKIKTENFNNTYQNYLAYYLIIILSLGTLFWFLKIPVFRYGYSYFIALFSICFAFFCSKNKFKPGTLYKTVNVFLILCLLFFTFKNTKRIYSNSNNYDNYPWPKYLGMDNNNSPPRIKKFVINNLTFYEPSNGDFCMYSKSPCGHYGARDISQTYKKLNYTFILPK